MAKNLQELIKPPFYHDGTACGFIYDGNTRIVDVCGYKSEDDREKSGNDSHLAKQRGWGFFRYFENGDELQDAFKDFLVSALNEKWERDFGEGRQ